jgi:hypothetical protein
LGDIIVFKRARNVGVKGFLVVGGGDIMVKLWFG